MQTFSVYDHAQIIPKYFTNPLARFCKTLKIIVFLMKRTDAASVEVVCKMKKQAETGVAYGYCYPH